MTEINLNFYPWQKGEKPYFVNPEGFEWYIDKGGTEYATKDSGNLKGLKNVMCFYVKKNDIIKIVLIDNKQNILAESTSLEGIGIKIDILKIAHQEKEK
jgi:hypothetical protein